MLIKDMKEQASTETQIGVVRETTQPSEPDEIGMRETVKILKTKSHENVELTAAQKKAEEKFFRTIDAAAKGTKVPLDASENHDKYIYGFRQD